MGSAHSVSAVGEEEEEDDDENEEEEDNENGPLTHLKSETHHLIKKVLEQEPEMLPSLSSASPLSPQLSSLGTPRIRVWDPYNVLAPPPPAIFSPVDEEIEVFLINHGESELNLRPDFVGGRCPNAVLTPNGKRQARALAVLLNSHGVRFNAVYASPLDRARSMAVSVCQEMSLAVEQIQTSDALTDISHGHWEGSHRSEVYTPEVLTLIEGSQPDICAPSGESLREVEFRMVQFLNKVVLRLPEKLRSDFLLHHQNDSHGFANHNPHDRDGPSLPPAHWDLLNRHRQLSRKRSGKSRLQFVNSTGDHEVDDEISPHTNPHGALNDLNIRSSSSVIPSCIGVFTHSVPIKCLLTGLLGCSPSTSHMFCIDDSSVTVLQHSIRTGWQIKRLNDTAHLRLL